MLSADVERIDFIVTPPHGLLLGDICLLCMDFVESACRVIIFFRFCGSFALCTHTCMWRETLCNLQDWSALIPRVLSNRHD